MGTIVEKYPEDVILLVPALLDAAFQLRAENALHGVILQVLEEQEGASLAIPII